MKAKTIFLPFVACVAGVKGERGEEGERGRGERGERGRDSGDGPFVFRLPNPSPFKPATQAVAFCE